MEISYFRQIVPVDKQADIVLGRDRRIEIESNFEIGIFLFIMVVGVLSISKINDGLT